MQNAAYKDFRQTVLQYYHAHGRHDLPWRIPDADGTYNPYRILISETMLQQTQVPRVIPKFAAFLQMFPDVRVLAKAPLGDVLVAWQGLGYNRRAKFLWQAARMIVTDFDGTLPQTLHELDGLPGIGINTAGAIMAYAWDAPVVFIETNIRTVYIHHFFHEQVDIPDKAITALLARTVPNPEMRLPSTALDSPRVWYWALMDYGVYLKQSIGNLSRASKTYAKQSTFIGSKRQLRGRVLHLLAQGPMVIEQLERTLEDDRTNDVLDSLRAEGMICCRGSLYELP